MSVSMTGFAAHTLNLGSAYLAIELKSVNQRYLEIGFRLSEELRALEPPIRDLIGGRLTRGKVECRMSLTALPAAMLHIGLNEAILENLARWQSEVRDRFADAAPLSTGEILRWPGLIQGAELASDTLATLALAGVEQALEELVQTRRREGGKLKQHILSRLAEAERLVAGLRPGMPARIQAQREKLAARLREALGETGHERLAQEVALFAQKIDVEEELSRLATHFSEVQRVLDQGGAIGKRLDFLMQELHREANTLGSKSAAVETTQASLELKVLIEQMREQVQNIE
jgi:uncharacterized protein (TIGR00255 family)